jgi:hypothetical protein
MSRMPLVLLCLPLVLAAARADTADYQPDPASVQRYGPAYRFPQAGWIVLHVEGKPYERGYQHGQLLAPEIAAYLGCFAAVQSAKAPAENWRNTRRLANALFVRRFEREFLEEMKGIADGAAAAGARFDNRPVDLVDIVALNCWPEIGTLDAALEATPTGLEGLRFPHAQPRAMPKPAPEHCSAFAATGPATADGKIVFGHITMFGLYPANFYNVWLDIKPARGHRMLMCAYPGAIQSGMDYYLNDAGLLIAETTISQTRFDNTGLTEASRIRQAIQYAANIDDAVAILRKDNNGLYTNEWLLADINTNEIALFELGTHQSKLHRSSKNDWIGGTVGFYWGCNNTKDVQVRLETVASVEGRPANVVFHPTDRDRAWQRLFHKHKGKIGVAFGKEAFTTPPIAAYPSLDAKFTTTALAKQLKSWALFGPPLGRTWEPTDDQRQRYPEIRPLVSHPWTLLHGNPPARAAKEIVAVDLPRVSSPVAAAAASPPRKDRPLLNAPAWHGTLLPASDGDLWLAAAFADYERIVAKENAFRQRGDGNLSLPERDELAVDLFGYRSAYLRAVRTGADVPLASVKPDLAQDHWYWLASGKGVLVLQALRAVLGDPLFEDTMDSFGREHAGQRVSTAQFQAHVEKAAGKRVDGFFDAWVRRPGLQGLRLGNVAVSKEAHNSSAPVYHVRGEIFEESCAFPSVKVEVTVETAGGEVTRTVQLKGAVTTFDIDAGTASPQRLVLDKYNATPQVHAPAYSIVSFHDELEDTLIVYGTADETPTNREAAETLQKAVRAAWTNITVPIRSDRDVTEAELKGHHLVLIGRPDNNTVVARFRMALPVAFGPRSFVVRGKTYAHTDSAVVVAAANPLNERFSLVVIAGLSAEATWHAPTNFVRRSQSPAQVLVLPHGQAAQALVLPARDLVRELKQP